VSPLRLTYYHGEVTGDTYAVEDMTYEVIGMSEIAQRLRRTRQQVRRIVLEGKLPPPDACEVQSGKDPRPLWRPETIRQWAEETNRTLVEE
jgi:hypothetical protein